MMGLNMSENTLEEVIYETIAKMGLCDNVANEYVVEIASKLEPEIDKILKLKRPQNKHIERIDGIIIELKTHIKNSEKIKKAINTLSKKELNFNGDTFLQGVFMLVKIEAELSLEYYVKFIAEQMQKCDEFYANNNLKNNSLSNNNI